MAPIADIRNIVHEKIYKILMWHIKLDYIIYKKQGDSILDHQDTYIKIVQFLIEKKTEPFYLLICYCLQKLNFPSFFLSFVQQLITEH